MLFVYRPVYAPKRSDVHIVMHNFPTITFKNILSSTKLQSVRTFLILFSLLQVQIFDVIRHRWTINRFAEYNSLSTDLIDDHLQNNVLYPDVGYNENC